MIGNRNLVNNEKKRCFLFLPWKVNDLDDNGSLIHIKLRKKLVEVRLIF